jgi:hypothetical protein
LPDQPRAADFGERGHGEQQQQRTSGHHVRDRTRVNTPDGWVIVAGAGHDGKVYRWEVATGRAVGEPLGGHRISVKAVATVTRADDTAMIVSG